MASITLRRAASGHRIAREHGLVEEAKSPAKHAPYLAKLQIDFGAFGTATIAEAKTCAGHGKTLSGCRTSCADWVNDSDIIAGSVRWRMAQKRFPPFAQQVLSRVALFRRPDSLRTA